MTTLNHYPSPSSAPAATDLFRSALALLQQIVEALPPDRAAKLDAAVAAGSRIEARLTLPVGRALPDLMFVLALPDGELIELATVNIEPRAHH